MVILRIRNPFQFPYKLALRAMIEYLFRDTHQLLPVVPLSNGILYGAQRFDEGVVAAILRQSKDVAKLLHFQAIGM